MPDELIRIYKEHFLPAYSDLVALTVEKPESILLEIESTLTHLMKYVMDEDKETNVKKAKGHVYRASLDCYKMMWDFIYESVSGAFEYREAYKGDEADLLQRRRELYDALRSARRMESREVGSEHEETLNLYKKALAVGLEIFYSTDQSILKKLKQKDRFKGPFTMYVFPAILCVIGVTATIYGIFFT